MMTQKKKKKKFRMIIKKLKLCDHGVTWNLYLGGQMKTRFEMYYIHIMYSTLRYHYIIV